MSPTILRELQTTASVETRIVQLENAMKEHFQLTDAEIHEVLAKFPFLWKKYYLYAFTYLSSIGVTKETFLRNPWLSTMTPESIGASLLMVKTVFDDWDNINKCAPLFHMPSILMKMKLSMWKVEAAGFSHPSKFHFLSAALDMPIQDVLHLIQDYPFLAEIPYCSLEPNINLFLRVGVKPEEIIADPWSLRYSPSYVESRVTKLLADNVPVKCWLVRASSEARNRFIREHRSMMNALDNEPDTKAYLRKRLECNQEEIDGIFVRVPLMYKRQPQRLKDAIDTLYKLGVTPRQIIGTPRILFLSPESLEKRILQLRALGHPLSSLSVVILSSARYKAVIDKLEQRGPQAVTEKESEPSQPTSGVSTNEATLPAV